jgi:ABC-type dipeptide/oligopeptide/nickel transport system permease component
MSSPDHGSGAGARTDFSGALITEIVFSTRLSGLLYNAIITDDYNLIWESASRL